MSITRYRPQMGRAFALPLDKPALFFKIVTPWFALALVAALLGQFAPELNTLAVVLRIVAIGALGYAVQRTLGGQSLWPKEPLDWARFLGWVAAFNILLMFEGLPAPFLQMWLGDRPDANVLILVGLQIFQVLIGAFFLILPHLALWQKSANGPTLPEIVLSGGLAVGLGYVIVGLPFVIGRDLLTRLDFGGGMVAELIPLVMGLVLAIWSVSVVAAYLTYVWQELQENYDEVFKKARALKQEAETTAPKAKKKRS